MAVMMRTTVAMLVLVAACAPPRLPPAPPREAKLGLAISARTLANGVRAVIVEDPGATAVQVTVRYAVGAIDDGAHPGMAHLAEHLMFQPVLDGQSVFAHLEDVATSFNAGTTYDATTFVARAPARELERLLAIEAARLEQRCRGLDDAAFEREREVVINELRQRDHATEIFGALHAALYPQDHAYRRALGGSVESVAAITRAEACAFVDARYAPSAAVVVVASRLPAAEVAAALDRFAGRVAARAVAPQPAVAGLAPRPAFHELDVPLDEDVFVIAWPLPREPVLQAKVRALAAALPRLIDGEIKGSAASFDLGDRGAPMFAIAVQPGTGESYRDAAEGARRAVAKLPEVFAAPANDGRRDLDGVAFDRLRQSAIYGHYAALDDGGGRDGALAAELAAGRDPAATTGAVLAALQRLSRDEGRRLASDYLTSAAATGVRLRAAGGRKRGVKVSLRAPIHDLGQRRTPPDPALAQRPAADEPARDAVAVHRRTLPNGLEVVLVPATTVPTFEARLIFRSGTGAEPAGRRGVALIAAKTLTWDLHFLDDLIPFARAGAMRDTDVGTDRTTFAVQGLDTNLDIVLGGLRRWVREGTYDDSAASFVAAMRAAARRADDQGPLTDAWRAALFGASHPYVHAGIVRHASTTLALDDAARFRAMHYTPRNATLVITGRFDPVLAAQWVEFLFGDWAGPAPVRTAVAHAPQPASIAKADDLALLQLRLAVPAGAAGRPQELVAAAMLDDIAHDVRHQLGASYSLDAQLIENRDASYVVLAGYVDPARAAEAVALIRDRVQALRTDADAAARAFVLARRRVLGRLRAQAAGAGALAARIEHDVAMAREPMSDLRTADAVRALTLADMAGALAALELPRAAVMMNGPEAEVGRAFAVLGRTPQFLAAGTAPDAVDAPGATPIAFAAPEQRVRYADVRPSLTAPSPPPLMLTIAPTYTFAIADRSMVSNALMSGAGFELGVAYRWGRRLVVGGYGRAAHLSPAWDIDVADFRITPVELIGTLHLRRERPSKVWCELLAGVQVQRVRANGRSEIDGNPVLGAGFGADSSLSKTHLVGVGFRYLREAFTDTRYHAFTISLHYRR